MRVISVAILALLAPSSARYQSLASIVDADSFEDEVRDTEPSTALLPGDAAEPIGKIELSPEMLDIKEKVLKKQKYDTSKINPYDGLIHAEDGHREFPDGTIVGGVNNFFARQRSADDFGMEADDSAEIIDAKKEGAIIDG